MQALAAGACGILFGVGLGIAGMTNPAKVLAFLDVAGRWDPTLALVMGGALAVNAAGFALVRRRVRPWLAQTFAIPTRRDLEPRLVAGAALFGIGWGLVGLCPGPAIAGLGRGSAELYVFLGAMLAGTALHRIASTRAGRVPTPAAR
jgi:uncharacterized membrane protein YedE/YeeE